MSKQQILISKFLLSAHTSIGLSASRINRFHSAENGSVDPSLDGKCADAIRHLACLAGFDLGLASCENCPDAAAVKRHGVRLHPGNPNSFLGRAVDESEVRAGDLILFKDTDPRYYGTGLVTHAALVMSVEKELLVDASYQMRKLSYRPWSTYSQDQRFGFWRPNILEHPPPWSEADVRRSFRDFHLRNQAIDSVQASAPRQALRAWNIHLRKLEIEEMLKLETLHVFLLRMLEATEQSLQDEPACEPDFEQLAQPHSNIVVKDLPFSGRVMRQLSRVAGRLGWHRHLRQLRSTLGILSRPQNQTSVAKPWEEPLAFRNFNNWVHWHWLSKSLPDQAFQCALKTDLYDESFSQGLASWLEKRSDVVCGVDLDRETQEAAQHRFPALLTFQADVQSLPFPDRSFDLVVSNSTLDHQEKVEELFQCLRELERVTMPGGRLVITLDNPENPILSLRNILPRFSFLTRLGLSPYFRGKTLSLETLAEELRKLGFEIEQQDFLFHSPRIVLVHLISRLPFAERVFKKLLDLEDWVPQRWRRRTGYFGVVLARKPLQG